MFDRPLPVEEVVEKIEAVDEVDLSARREVRGHLRGEGRVVPEA